MKVTKAIREYITEEIDDMFAPKLAEIKKEKDELQKQAIKHVMYYKKKCDELNKEIENDFKERTGYAYTTPYRSSRSIVECNLHEDYVVSSNPKYKELREKEEALDNKREKSLRNTIAMLELGGTKAELDEVLAQIKEELA